MSWGTRTQSPSFVIFPSSGIMVPFDLAFGNEIPEGDPVHVVLLGDVVKTLVAVEKLIDNILILLRRSDILKEI